MATLTRSITIDAPVATVLDFASDSRRLWVAKDVALTEIDIKPEGVGTSARTYSHLLGFPLEGGNVAQVANLKTQVEAKAAA